MRLSPLQIWKQVERRLADAEQRAVGQCFPDPFKEFRLRRSLPFSAEDANVVARMKQHAFGPVVGRRPRPALHPERENPAMHVFHTC